MSGLIPTIESRTRPHIPGLRELHEEALARTQSHVTTEQLDRAIVDLLKPAQQQPQPQRSVRKPAVRPARSVRRGVSDPDAEADVSVSALSSHSLDSDASDVASAVSASASMFASADADEQSHSVASHNGVEPEPAQVIFYDPSESEDVRLSRAVCYIHGALLGEPVVTRRGRWVARAQLLEYDSRYRWFRSLVCVALLLPLFFEPVSWRADAQRDCDAQCRAPAAAVELLLALLCVAFAAVRVVLFGIDGLHQYPATLLAGAVAALIAADALFALAAASAWPWRPTRVLRPLMMIIYNSNMLHLSGAAVRAVPYVADLLVLSFLILLVYATMGVQLFRDDYLTAAANLRPDNATLGDLLPSPEADFGGLASAIVALFVLMTTENYPSTMYPALAQSSWALLFFASFILLVTLLLLNTFVAVTFSAFENTYNSDALERRVHERFGLLAAFELATEGDTEARLHYTQWQALWSRLRRNQISFSRVVFKCLDQDNSATLGLVEFFRLPDVLQLTFSEVREPKAKEAAIGVAADARSAAVLALFARQQRASWRGRVRHALRNIGWRRTRFRKAVKRLVQSRAWSYVVLALIVANVIVLCLFYHNQPRDEIATLTKIDTALAAAFVIELSMRMWALGIRHFWRSWWNRFDLLIVALLIAVEGVLLAVGDGASEQQTAALQSVSALRAVRAFQALRFVRASVRAQTLALSLISVMPIAARLFLLTAALLYSYVVVGLEAFGGGATSTLGPASFDTVGGGCLAVFQLLSSSNFHVILYSAISGTGTLHAVWYFVSFYILILLVIFNLLISIVLETFNAHHRALVFGHQLQIDVHDDHATTTLTVADTDVAPAPAAAASGNGKRDDDDDSHGAGAAAAAGVAADASESRSDFASASQHADDSSADPLQVVSLRVVRARVDEFDDGAGTSAVVASEASFRSADSSADDAPVAKSPRATASPPPQPTTAAMPAPVSPKATRYIINRQRPSRIQDVLGEKNDAMTEVELNRLQQMSGWKLAKLHALSRVGQPATPTLHSAVQQLLAAKQASTSATVSATVSATTSTDALPRSLSPTPTAIETPPRVTSPVMPARGASAGVERGVGGGGGGGGGAAAAAAAAAAAPAAPDVVPLASMKKPKSMPAIKRRTSEAVEMKPSARRKPALTSREVELATSDDDEDVSDEQYTRQSKPSQRALLEMSFAGTREWDAKRAEAGGDDTSEDLSEKE